MYNLISLLLGLLAWILGAAALRKNRWQSFASLSACCLSLFFQLTEALVQVREGDWSTLLDTWDTVVAAAALLVGVTLALNGMVVLRQPGTRKKQFREG